MKKRPKELLRLLLAFTAMLALLLNSAFAAVIAEGDATLTDRIAAAGEGEVIALDKDYTEAITIPAGAKITLDLAGKKLTSTTATVVTNNGDLTLTDSVGGGRIERTAQTGDTTGIRNNSGAVLKMEAGTIEVITVTSGTAVGIYNAGRITEIAGGEILASTPGSTYAYGISNQGGTIDLISDGYVFGGITAFNKNGNNAMAINNGSNGTITSITGGVFVGSVRTEVTALCFMLFSLMHWPCSTTLLTVYKETGSWKWTGAAALIPTLCGGSVCILVSGAAALHMRAAAPSPPTTTE